MISKSQILKKFDEKFARKFNIGVMPDDITKDQIKDFISKIIDDICKELPLEKGIKWMQEGDKKERRGYTQGYNEAVKELNDRLLKLKK